MNVQFQILATRREEPKTFLIVFNEINRLKNGTD